MCLSASITTGSRHRTLRSLILCPALGRARRRRRALVLSLIHIFSPCRTGVRFPGRKGACPCVQNRPVPRVRGPYVRRHNTATRKNSQRTDADNLPFGRSGVPAVRVSSSGRNEQLSGSVSDAVSRGGPSLCKAMALGARRLASYGAVLRRRKRGYGEMKKKKITFSEPNCRFGCPHFKSVGSVLNETCYCMRCV